MAGRTRGILKKAGKKVAIGLLAGASAMPGCMPVKPYLDRQTHYAVEQAPSVIERIETRNSKWLAKHRQAMEKKGQKGFEWVNDKYYRGFLNDFLRQREKLSSKIVEAKEAGKKAEKNPEKYRQTLNNLLNEIEELHQDLAHQESMFYYSIQRDKRR